MQTLLNIILNQNIKHRPSSTKYIIYIVFGIGIIVQITMFFIIQSPYDVFFYFQSNCGFDNSSCANSVAILMVFVVIGFYFVVIKNSSTHIKNSKISPIKLNIIKLIFYRNIHTSRPRNKQGILDKIKSYTSTSNSRDIATLYLVFAIFTGTTITVLCVINYVEFITLNFKTIYLSFLLLLVALFGLITNHYVPQMVGKNNMAFPQLNNISFWLLISPLFRIISDIYSSDSIPTDITIFFIHVIGTSSIVMAINVISTLVLGTSSTASQQTFSEWLKYIKGMQPKVIIYIIFTVLYVVCIIVFINIISIGSYKVGVLANYLHPIITFFFYAPISVMKIVSIITIYYNKKALYPNNNVLGKALYCSYLSVWLIFIALSNPMFFFSISFPASIGILLILQIIFNWKFKYKITMLYIILAIIFFITSSQCIIALGLAFVTEGLFETNDINNNLPQVDKSKALLILYKATIDHLLKMLNVFLRYL